MSKSQWVEVRLSGPHIEDAIIDGDFNELQEVKSGAITAELITEDENTIEIRFKNKIYTLAPFSYTLLPFPPRFKWDDTVAFTDSENLNQKAKITAIIWHHKNQQYQFTIEQDGKKLSKNYAESELSTL